MLRAGYTLAWLTPVSDTRAQAGVRRVRQVEGSPLCAWHATGKGMVAANAAKWWGLGTGPMNSTGMKPGWNCSGGHAREGESPKHLPSCTRMACRAARRSTTSTSEPGETAAEPDPTPPYVERGRAAEIRTFRQGLGRLLQTVQRRGRTGCY